MTVTETHITEPVVPSADKASLSPCKRQRLDEGYETESSDSVEDMLRDISSRCNAVLHGAAPGHRLKPEAETIRMHGAFSGLQTCVSKESSIKTEGAEPEESVSSFRTSIKEHCTIKTQVFPHGRAFTSRTQQGGYRFRWVPNHSWKCVHWYQIGSICASNYGFECSVCLFMTGRKCGWAVTDC